MGLGGGPGLGTGTGTSTTATTQRRFGRGLGFARREGAAHATRRTTPAGSREPSGRASMGQSVEVAHPRSKGADTSGGPSQGEGSWGAAPWGLLVKGAPSAGYADTPFRM